MSFEFVVLFFLHLHEIVSLKPYITEMSDTRRCTWCPNGPRAGWERLPKAFDDEPGFNRTVLHPLHVGYAICLCHVLGTCQGMDFIIHYSNLKRYGE